MTTLNFLTRTLLFCFLISFARLGLAAESHRYQVDLLIFTQADANALQSEHWNPVSPLMQPESAIDLSDTAASDTLERLSKTAGPLIRTDNVLRRNPHYKILFHAVWRQDFNRFQTEKPLWIDTDSLKGLIHLNMNRFFEFKADLIYQMPLSELYALVPANLYKGQNIVDNSAYFQLTQERRLKSRELNYLDHPILGVLIDIVPVA